MILLQDSKVPSIWKKTLIPPDRLLCQMEAGTILAEQLVYWWCQLPSRACSATRRPHSHTCILQATTWGYCCTQASISPTVGSGPQPLLSPSPGTQDGQALALGPPSAELPAQ